MTKNLEVKIRETKDLPGAERATNYCAALPPLSSSAVEAVDDKVRCHKVCNASA